MDLFVDNRSGIILEEVLLEKMEECVILCLRTEKYSENVEISISLVDNDEIHQLNLKYRKMNSSTDVLSFSMLEADTYISSDTTIILGDIVISIEKTMEQAQEFGHAFVRELCYLTVHGMFHLLGYDHMQEEDKATMREKEKCVMRKIIKDSEKNI